LPHEVTDRLFVIRRAYRLNDNLPPETGVPRWQWQRGGWLMVDRVTGRVSQVALPEFDAFYSAASWYRVTRRIAASPMMGNSCMRW
jgi:hypothetical protein